MSTTRALRPLPLGLALLAAMIGAAVALVVAGAPDALADGSGRHSGKKSDLQEGARAS